MARWDIPHVIQSQVFCACHGFWTVASFFLVKVAFLVVFFLFFFNTEKGVAT